MPLPKFRRSGGAHGVPSTLKEGFWTEINPITAEFSATKAGPTASWKSTQKGRWLSAQLNGTREEAEKYGLLREAMREEYEGLDKALDDRFLKDFHMYLQGRIPAGYRRPIWGDKQISHISAPGVKEYIDSHFKEREAFEADLLRMHKMGPVSKKGKTNLFWHYLYFKYIISACALTEENFNTDYRAWLEETKEFPGGNVIITDNMNGELQEANENLDWKKDDSRGRRIVGVNPAFYDGRASNPDSTDWPHLVASNPMDADPLDQKQFNASSLRTKSIHQRVHPGIKFKNQGLTFKFGGGSSQGSPSPSQQSNWSQAEAQARLEMANALREAQEVQKETLEAAERREEAMEKTLEEMRKENEKMQKENSENNQRLAAAIEALAMAAKGFRPEVKKEEDEEPSAPDWNPGDDDDDDDGSGTGPSGPSSSSSPDSPDQPEPETEPEPEGPEYAPEVRDWFNEMLRQNPDAFLRMKDVIEVYYLYHQNWDFDQFKLIAEAQARKQTNAAEASRRKAEAARLKKLGVRWMDDHPEFGGPVQDNPADVIPPGFKKVEGLEKGYQGTEEDYQKWKAESAEHYAQMRRKTPVPQDNRETPPEAAGSKRPKGQAFYTQGAEPGRAYSKREAKMLDQGLYVKDKDGNLVPAQKQILPVGASEDHSFIKLLMKYDDYIEKAKTPGLKQKLRDKRDELFKEIMMAPQDEKFELKDYHWHPDDWDTMAESYMPQRMYKGEGRDTDKGKGKGKQPRNPDTLPSAPADDDEDDDDDDDLSPPPDIDLSDLERPPNEPQPPASSQKPSRSKPRPPEGPPPPPQDDDDGSGSGPKPGPAAPRRTFEMLLDNIGLERGGTTTIEMLHRQSIAEKLDSIFPDAVQDAGRLGVPRLRQLVDNIYRYPEIAEHFYDLNGLMPPTTFPELTARWNQSVERARTAQGFATTTNAINQRDQERERENQRTQAELQALREQNEALRRQTEENKTDTYALKDQAEKAINETRDAVEQTRHLANEAISKLPPERQLAAAHQVRQDDQRIFMEQQQEEHRHELARMREQAMLTLIQTMATGQVIDPRLVQQRGLLRPANRARASIRELPAPETPNVQQSQEQPALPPPESESLDIQQLQQQLALPPANSEPEPDWVQNEQGMMVRRPGRPVTMNQGKPDGRPQPTITSGELGEDGQVEERAEAEAEAEDMDTGEDVQTQQGQAREKSVNPHEHRMSTIKNIARQLGVVIHRKPDRLLPNRDAREIVADLEELTEATQQYNTTFAARAATGNAAELQELRETGERLRDRFIELLRAGMHYIANDRVLRVPTMMGEVPVHNAITFLAEHVLARPLTQRPRSNDSGTLMEQLEYWQTPESLRAKEQAIEGPDGLPTRTRRRQPHRTDPKDYRGMQNTTEDKNEAADETYDPTKPPKQGSSGGNGKKKKKK